MLVYQDKKMLNLFFERYTNMAANFWCFNPQSENAVYKFIPKRITPRAAY